MTHSELLAHMDTQHLLPYDEATIRLIRVAINDFPAFLVIKHDDDHKWMRNNPSQTVLPDHNHYDHDDIPF